MASIRLLRRLLLCALFLFPAASAQQPQPAPPVPTFHATSNLVFLDVTVLDKKGRPVVKGLTRDDFSLTEESQPRDIFSFEPPDTHVARKGKEIAPENAPLTIFVLDQLNSSFQDFWSVRYGMRTFLMGQPRELAAPAEVVVIRDDSLEMIQGYTRSRDELLSALQHLPSRLPYKMAGAFFWERFAQSLDALQQIALQNKGVPGRKNVVWVGHGGPSVVLTSADFSDSNQERMKRYVHSTTNLLVNSRISLFVVNPGLPTEAVTHQTSAVQAKTDREDYDPYAGDVNFGLFVSETGGKFFYNRNDVGQEIDSSVHMGGQYYTLTYQPGDVLPDGKFRKIRVSLRDANLHAVTKIGYYAPAKNAVLDPRQERMTILAESLTSTIPYETLGLQLSDVVRHPDAESTEVHVELASRNISFLPAEDGQQAAQLIVAAASLDKNRTVLVSKMEPMTLHTRTAAPAKLPQVASRFQLTIRVPRKTQVVRVVVASQEGGQIGTAEITRKMIDSAPSLPTPATQDSGEFAGPQVAAKP